MYRSSGTLNIPTLDKETSPINNEKEVIYQENFFEMDLSKIIISFKMKVYYKIALDYVDEGLTNDMILFMSDHEYSVEGMIYRNSVHLTRTILKTGENKEVIMELCPGAEMEIINALFS